LEHFAISYKNAPTVFKMFVHIWISIRNFPRFWMLFLQQIVNILLKMMKIKKINTTPCHPQTNAQAEFCNKTIAA
jgi:hypothetical protein